VANPTLIVPIIETQSRSTERLWVSRSSFFKSS